MIEGAAHLRIELQTSIAHDVQALKDYYKNIHPSEIDLSPALSRHINEIYNSSSIQQVLLCLDPCVMVVGRDCMEFVAVADAEARDCAARFGRIVSRYLIPQTRGHPSI